MSKTTVFELTKTLKCGQKVYSKGSVFNEDTLPADLKSEVDLDYSGIKVVSYGEDFEGSNFDPDKTVLDANKTVFVPEKIVKSPKKVLKPKKRV